MTFAMGGVPHAGPQQKWSSHHSQQKSPKCSTWMQSQERQNDLCSFPRQPNHIMVILWQPTPVFLPGESQGPGSLVGFRQWGHTESDTTEVT